MLIEPFVARTPQALVVRRYVSVVGLVVAGGVLLSAAAALEPRPILWLLGSQYDGLGEEAALTVLSASVNWVALVLWTMNDTRRWVFGWQTTLYIVLTIVTQVIRALVLDLSTTQGA